MDKTPLTHGWRVRAPGMVRGADGRFLRAVDRYVVHGRGLDFRDLCRRVIRPETKYLVLDLDGTFHRGLNLGVLLGWELCAYEAYGLEYLQQVEKTRGQGAAVVNWRAHKGRLRYCTQGPRRWAVPGGIYYLLARIGWKNRALRRTLRRTLGPQAMDRLLGLMRLNLMHHLAGADLSDVRELVKSLWRRHEDRLVIEPGDVAWVRETWPGLTVIVSSASPSVCLDVVRETYPVHDVISTEIEEHEGRPAAPHLLHPLVSRGRPGRIAPPSGFSENASHNKIARLLERYPDFLDPDVHTVGMTDTKHGEDHAWAEYFKCLADVNSPDPFPPVVSAASPLSELHSAALLTRAARREAVIPPEKARELSRGDLETLLAPEIARAEDLAAQCFALVERNARALDEIHGRLSVLTRVMNRAATLYNQAAGAARDQAFAVLIQALSHARRLDRRRSSLLAPLASPWSALEQVLETARARARETPRPAPIPFPDTPSLPENTPHAAPGF